MSAPNYYLSVYRKGKLYFTCWEQGNIIIKSNHKKKLGLGWSLTEFENYCKRMNWNIRINYRLSDTLVSY